MKKIATIFKDMLWHAYAIISFIEWWLICDTGIEYIIWIIYNITYYLLQYNKMEVKELKR